MRDYLVVMETPKVFDDSNQTYLHIIKTKASHYEAYCGQGAHWQTPTYKLTELSKLGRANVCKECEKRMKGEQHGNS